MANNWGYLENEKTEEIRSEATVHVLLRHSLSFILQLSLAAHKKYAPTQPTDCWYIFKTTFIYGRVTSMTQGKLGLVKLQDDPAEYLRSILGQT